jgi:HK97 family phage prohead protease
MTVLDRAFSFLEVKSVDDERRMVEGWATTPKLDRQGDIVDWEGLTYGNSIKLLLYHTSTDKPVGNVKFDKPTKRGMPFEAYIPKVVEPGTLKDRVDEAWHSVKYDLIAAVSIGFRVIDDAIERIETGYKFLKTEILELSLVPVPANDQAVITSFKSMDAAAIESIKDVLAKLDAIKEIQTAAPAASGKTVRVVKLNDPARDRAKPFVIRKVRPG